jgi:hypothetical protein
MLRYVRILTSDRLRAAWAADVSSDTGQSKMPPFNGAISNWHNLSDYIHAYALEKRFWHVPLGRPVVAPDPPAVGGPPAPGDTTLMKQLEGFLAPHVIAEIWDDVLPADTVVHAWFTLKRRCSPQVVRVART